MASPYLVKEADAAMRSLLVPQLQEDDALRDAVLQMGTNDGTLTLGRLKHFMGAASHRPQPETSLDTGAVILQLISKVRKATKLEKAAVTPSRRRVGRPRKRKAGTDDLESHGGYAAGMPDAEGEVFSPASSSSTSPSPSPSLLLLPRLPLTPAPVVVPQLSLQEQVEQMKAQLAAFFAQQQQ